jgi:hypothetical protein
MNLPDALRLNSGALKDAKEYELQYQARGQSGVIIIELHYRDGKPTRVKSNHTVEYITPTEPT